MVVDVVVVVFVVLGVVLVVIEVVASHYCYQDLNKHRQEHQNHRQDHQHRSRLFRFGRNLLELHPRSPPDLFRQLGHQNKRENQVKPKVPLGYP